MGATGPVRRRELNCTELTFQSNIIAGQRLLSEWKVD